MSVREGTGNGRASVLGPTHPPLTGIRAAGFSSDYLQEGVYMAEDDEDPKHMITPDGT